ncbi:siderophore-interacting protein [Nocardioides sp. GY 10127]|uniref:siderophore-interacting protein n=1 Tax=Nocardioides sp. GY 10127 TaxID=2569762 RepID=UPI001F0DED99|nr:siderophore-interacting protein [Nocardioides sp. GY 10127]
MHGVVTSVERLTPSLVRVVLGGDGLSGFWPDAGETPDTDAYVNLALPPAGADYGPVFDPAEVKETHPRELQPARRRYTVRAWDPDALLLTLDFVVHGDEGAAGALAASARPGDVLVLTGPGSGYRPDPSADVHLLVGDESAVPAIAVALESLPAGARAVVRLVCDGPDHELALVTRADADVAWVHRTPEDPTPLPAAVAALARPEGRVHAFVHGEADEVREIRRHLLGTWGLARSDMSCSPYWRRTMTDEAWRAVKREYVKAMDADA